MELLAEFLEILAVHGDFRGILSFWNSEMLRVESDQIQPELSSLFLASIFKYDVHMLGILLGMKSDLVVVGCNLEYLGEVPLVFARSAFYDSNPTEPRVSETRATWLESMACSEMPWGVASMLTSVTRSLMESTIRLSTCPSVSFENHW